MNWSKNVYTFMLGAIIVLSGCMGAGTTEGMEEDDAEATTVINNYYNNTTEIITEIPEKIALGGLVINHASYDVNTTATINTSAGQMLRIEEFSCYSGPNNPSYCAIRMDIVCTDGVNFFVPMVIANFASWSLMPGSAFDCTHYIGIYGTGQYQEISWSVVYSIVPVTVG
jgi:hypothetical protein